MEPGPVEGEAFMKNLQSKGGTIAAGTANPDSAAAKKPTVLEVLRKNFLLRRQYLINSKRQLRAAFLVSLVALIPSIFLNIALHLSATAQTQALFADAPGAVMQQVSEQDRTDLLLILIGTLVYVGGVFLLTILETHQTSGAAVGINRHFRNIRDGRYDAKLNLRDSDNLLELVGPFNQMTEALTQRAIQSSKLLNDLAMEAEALDGGGVMARQLRELAVSHAHLAGKSR